MKNRDEYLESIYSKRDKKIRERKKTITALTSIFCIVICFAAVFVFVPKNLETKIPVNESGAGNSDIKIVSSTNTSDTTAVSEDIFTFAKAYTVIQGYNSGIINNNADNRVNSEIKATKKNEETSAGNKLQTEIAAEKADEATTRIKYFGYIEEKDDSGSLISGEPAIAPAEPHENFGTEVTGSYHEVPDSINPEETKASTTAAHLRSAEEATAEAEKAVPKEDASKIIDEKTMVTVTRTANGKTTYTVYFYTNTKSIEIELDALTLNVIECKEKNLITGKNSYYSPAHFPETTAALPEYKPQ